jgi:hypothetical protein
MAKALSRICFFMVDEALGIYLDISLGTVSRPVGCRAVGLNVAFPTGLARPIRLLSYPFQPTNYLDSLTALMIGERERNKHGDESRCD